ncbi:MAG: NAD(P)-dependent oxidoreductase [Dehalococcoidia bacterium]
MTIERAGFVGLGIMGGPMAANLLRAGFALTVWNRTANKAEPLVTAGATAAGSPAEVARASQVVVICVSDSPDVEEVVLGPRGVAEGASPGTIVIDCSTIAPATARKVAAALGERGVQFLDAPVSGGDVGAKAGTLAIMVGGDADAFEQARPVLEAMGKTIVHVGPSGAGQVVKLCNQVAGALNLLAMAEAIALCRRSGVDPARMLEVVSKGAAGSWMIENLGPRAIAGDFAPGFTVELMQKDLRLIAEAAAETQTALPGSVLVQQLLRGLEARGRGKDGTQAIVDAVRALTEDVQRTG